MRRKEKAAVPGGGAARSALSLGEALLAGTAPNNAVLLLDCMLSDNEVRTGAATLLRVRLSSARSPGGGESRRPYSPPVLPAPAAQRVLPHLGREAGRDGDADAGGPVPRLVREAGSAAALPGYSPPAPGCCSSTTPSRAGFLRSSAEQTRLVRRGGPRSSRRRLTVPPPAVSSQSFAFEALMEVRTVTYSCKLPAYSGHSVCAASRLAPLATDSTNEC